MAEAMRSALRARAVALLQEERAGATATDDVAPPAPSLDELPALAAAVKKADEKEAKNAPASKLNGSKRTAAHKAWQAKDNAARC